MCSSDLLRITAATAKNQAIQRAVPDVISQIIISMLYAQAFYNLRVTRQRFVYVPDPGDDLDDSELVP